MRLTAAEKAEVIRLVEGSDLSARRTLAELGVQRSTFYAWYRRYAAEGDAGLVARKPAARRYWNRIPPAVRARVVTAALADPERSPREMTQGKIERYHRSMKNLVKLEKYYSPWELERAIGRFVEPYNHRRLHESRQNVTPADMYAGRQQAILDRRARLKRATLVRRKRENLRVA